MHSLTEQVAVRWEGSLRLAWTRALAGFQARVNDYDALRVAVDWSAFEREMAAAMLPWMATVYYQGAAKHADILPVVLKAVTPFNVTNAEALVWAEQYLGVRIRSISEESRRAIRIIVQGALSGRYDTQEAARLIRLSIGLTERQAQAIENLRLELDDQVAAEKITAEQAAKQVNDQRLRSLAQRADMIARTESMAAANSGQQALWVKGIREGYIPPDVMRILIVADDEKLCIQCRSIASKGPVGIDQPFVDNTGTSHDAPPIHPACRCAMGLVYPEAQAA